MAEPESTVINTSVKQVSHFILAALCIHLFSALTLSEFNPSCIMIVNSIFTCLYPLQLYQLATLPNICLGVTASLMHVAVNHIVIFPPVVMLHIPY